MSQEQINSFRLAIQEDPSDADSHYNLACVIVFTYGEDLYADNISSEIQMALLEAKGACETALSIMNNHGSAMVLLGQIFYFQKDNQSAEHWFLKGLEMDPYNQTWLTGADNLARIYMLSERIDDAIEILEKLVAYHPEYGPAQTKLDACRNFKNLNVVKTAQDKTTVLVAEFQSAVQAVMMSEDSAELKAEKMQTLQAEFQAKMQKLHAA